MEDQEYQEKSGFFHRVAGMFVRDREEDEQEEQQQPVARKGKGKESASIPSLRATARYTVTVRRQVTSFDDATAAAEGLKRGEQQILNLSGTDIALRQKIVDFMCGVNFAQEGTWEELGENVYMIVPSYAYVEVAPATPRMAAVRN